MQIFEAQKRPEDMKLKHDYSLYLFFCHVGKETNLLDIIIALTLSTLQSKKRFWKNMQNLKQTDNKNLLFICCLSAPESCITFFNNFSFRIGNCILDAV